LDPHRASKIVEAGFGFRNEASLQLWFIVFSARVFLQIQARMLQPKVYAHCNPYLGPQFLFICMRSHDHDVIISAAFLARFCYIKTIKN